MCAISLMGVGFILFYRSRADVVLKEAINVTQALDDADKAQALANEAIEVAKNNIVLADSDLKQVGKIL